MCDSIQLWVSLDWGITLYYYKTIKIKVIPYLSSSLWRRTKMEANKDQNEELCLVPFSSRFLQYVSEQFRLITYKTCPDCNAMKCLIHVCHEMLDLKHLNHTVSKLGVIVLGHPVMRTKKRFKITNSKPFHINYLSFSQGKGKMWMFKTCLTR